MGIVVGLFFALVAGFLGLMYHANMQGKLAPFMIFGALGIGLLAVIAWGYTITVFSDTSPKLSIQVNGITDYRSSTGTRRILWSEIQSMDAEITKTNETVTGAKLILYVLVGAFNVEEVHVELAGLDSSAESVLRLIKITSIESGLRGGM